MKTIQPHEAHAVVGADQSIRISHLPFEVGERVRVTITEERGTSHTPEQIAQSRAIRQSLRGSILHYERPDEPVGFDDWQLLR